MHREKFPVLIVGSRNTVDSKAFNSPLCHLKVTRSPALGSPTILIDVVSSNSSNRAQTKGGHLYYP